MSRELKICIYTAVCGNYDHVVQPVPQSVPCDYKLFDDTVPRAARNMPDKLTSLMRAVWLRLFPFDIPELDEYDVLIYIDGNVDIKDPHLVARLLKTREFCVKRPAWSLQLTAEQPLMLDLVTQDKSFDLMVPVHPWTKTIERECQESRRWHTKYTDTDLEGQVARYTAEGFPFATEQDEHAHFWNGFLVWNRHCDMEKVCAFQTLYWAEMKAPLRSSVAHPQGQVCLPYVLWKSPINLHVLRNMNRTPEVGIRLHLR